MGNVITVDLGLTGPGSQYIASIYKTLSNNPPEGYSVLAHKSIGDLCDQVADLGQKMLNFEVISHGNPYFLGQITVSTVPQLAQALRQASPVAQFFFSGCNTGTYTDPTSQFCISKYLASLVVCKVYGAMGYIINAGTYAQGNAVCIAQDAPFDTKYLGSRDATGTRVYDLKPRTSSPRYVVPFPPSRPISIASTTLSNAARSVLTNLIGSVASLPDQSVPINPQVAPDFCIQTGSNVYDFYGEGAVIRQESNGFTWKTNIDPKSKAILTTIAMPIQVTTAVVAAPAPAEKVGS